jgi:recombinational DNA repair ATPase RecF
MKDHIIIAASSDWHISNHTQFSEIDDTGRPSRLLQFEALAKDFRAFANSIDADFSVIAGDIVDNAVMKPMVLDILESVIETLSHDRPLLVTHGQHDIDTKTENLAHFHSVLRRFGLKQNVVYMHDATSFTIVNCEDFRICGVPWNSEHKIPSDLQGDVFIGHGMVQGCTNAEGHQFRSGFSQEDLFSKFKLSIIGDIHNGQVFTGQWGRTILIPGSPIQFDYRDSPATGFWQCKVFKYSDTPECEFTSIQDIHPNHYHKFMFTDDPERISSRLVHYRYRAPKSVGQSKGKALEFKKDTSSITELGLSIIKRSKIDNQELVSNIFYKLMESLPSSDRKVPRSKLHSLEAHNFLSIEDFALNLKEFPDSLVLTGKNGSGKSSVVEAIFWCLTGSTTKGVAANEVRNWYGDTGTFVAVVIEVEGVMYRIGRGRTDSGPQLQIFTFIDKWLPYTGSKTSITQETIYELLGISEWEIKLLSYFPAKSPSLFGSITKSDRYTLLSTIVGMSAVDTARDKLGDLIKDNSSTIVQIESKIKTLKDIRDISKNKLSEYLTKRDAQSTVDTTSLERERNEIEAQLKLTVPSKGIRESLDRCNYRSNVLASEKFALEAGIKDVRNMVSRISREIETKKASLRMSLDGKCPTCHQQLLNEDVVDKLTVEIESLKAQLPNTGLERTLTIRLTEKDIEYLSNNEDIASLKTKLERILILEDRLALINSGLAEVKEARTNYEALIQAEASSISEFNTEIQTTELSLETKSNLQEAMNWTQKTLLKRNGLLISELAKQGQRLLQNQVDLLTDGESFRVIIEDDLSVSAMFMGREKADYDQLSTGQARVVDIIMMVSLNNLFTQMYGMDHGVLGVVIFDEVLSFLDPSYSEYCFELINKANVPKKIVVTHDESLISKFNHEINVTLEGSDSSVYTKNWVGDWYDQG